MVASAAQSSPRISIRADDATAQKPLDVRRPICLAHLPPTLRLSHEPLRSNRLEESVVALIRGAVKCGVRGFLERAQSLGGSSGVNRVSWFLVLVLAKLRERETRGDRCED